MGQFLHDAELIDLGDYVYSGEGANGASYDHRTDTNVMVKLYNPSMDVDLVYLEHEIARKVYDAGIPSPEPGCFVTDGRGRYGIRFRRLVGKVSYARAIGNAPSEVDRYARDFARMARQLHSTHLPDGVFPSVKDQYLSMLGENPFWTDPEKDVLAGIISSTPDTDTAVHGDLQYGNLLLADGKSYFIDLGEFACGHPYFDLGMTLICGRYNDEEFTRTAFHMDRKTAIRFWEVFVDEYFEGRYTPAEADRILFPYAVVKSLLIERNMGARFRDFHELFAKMC